MLKGLFLDPRTWAIDYKTSPFWNPKQFGIDIDLHPNAFLIPKKGIGKGYKFAITTEVWEIPMQKTLYFLRQKGVKIILAPREMAPTESHFGILFNNEKFKFNNSCYFVPDLLLAPGEQYSFLWRDKVKKQRTIGCPRFDVYLKRNLWKTREQILKQYGLEDKKLIFFPSYPPFYPQTVNGKHKNADLSDDLQSTLKELESYAKQNNKVQVVVKIHPYSQKCYNKKIGQGNEVIGLLREYYKKPTKYMKVIGDVRTDSSIARDMIIGADFVIGYASMMLLESLIIEKPTLHIKLSQAQQLKDTIKYDTEIKTIYNKSDICGSLEDMLKSPNEYKVKNSKLVEYYLHKIDGNFCERMCTEIREMFNG